MHFRIRLFGEQTVGVRSTGLTVWAEGSTKTLLEFARPNSVHASSPRWVRRYPTLQSIVEILDGWTGYSHHVGACDLQELMANKEDVQWTLHANLTLIHRMKLGANGSVHNAITTMQFIFSIWKIAQDEDLLFWQSMSSAGQLRDESGPLQSRSIVHFAPKPHVAQKVVFRPNGENGQVGPGKPCSNVMVPVPRTDERFQVVSQAETDHDAHRRKLFASLCRQIHLTREFFSNTFALSTHHIVAQGLFGAHSLHLHVIHDVTCLSVRCLFSFCLLPHSLAPLLSLHCLPVLCPAHQLPHVESAED